MTAKVYHLSENENDSQPLLKLILKGGLTRSKRSVI